MTPHHWNRPMFIFEGHASCCEKSIYGAVWCSLPEWRIYMNSAFCDVISQCLIWNMSSLSPKRMTNSQAKLAPHTPAEPRPQRVVCHLTKMMSMESAGMWLPVLLVHLLYCSTDTVSKCLNLSAGVRKMKPCKAPWFATPLAVFYNAYLFLYLKYY